MDCSIAAMDKNNGYGWLKVKTNHTMDIRG